MTLSNAPPRAEYDQNGKERDCGDRSPDRNAPHRWMERCTRLHMSVVRGAIFIVRAIALMFVSLSLDHYAAPSVVSPCSWRANSSSSSHVNSFFRSKL